MAVIGVYEDADGCGGKVVERQKVFLEHGSRFATVCPIIQCAFVGGVVGIIINGVKRVFAHGNACGCDESACRIVRSDFPHFGFHFRGSHAVVALTHSEDVALCIGLHDVGIHSDGDFGLLGEIGSAHAHHTKAIGILVGVVVTIRNGYVNTAVGTANAGRVRAYFQPLGIGFEAECVDAGKVSVVARNVHIAVGSADAFGRGHGNLSDNAAGSGVDAPNEIAAVHGDIQARTVNHTGLWRVA